MIPYADSNGDFCSVTSGFSVISEIDLSISDAKNITRIRMRPNESNPSIFSEKCQKVCKSFPNLKSLDLQRSNINDLKRFTFAGAKNMEELLLGFNNLTVLHNFTFYYVMNLKNLCLANNMIHTIKKNAFSELANLEILHLERNMLSFFDPETFFALHSLEDLKLQDNPIIELKESFFDNNRLLKSLTFNGFMHIHSADYQFLMVLKNQTNHVGLSEKLVYFPLDQCKQQLKTCNVRLENWERSDEDLYKTFEYENYNKVVNNNILIAQQENKAFNSRNASQNCQSSEDYADLYADKIANLTSELDAVQNLLRKYDEHVLRPEETKKINAFIEVPINEITYNCTAALDNVESLRNLSQKNLNMEKEIKKLNSVISELESEMSIQYENLTGCMEVLNDENFTKTENIVEINYEAKVYNLTKLYEQNFTILNNKIKALEKEQPRDVDGQSQAITFNSTELYTAYLKKDLDDMKKTRNILWIVTICSIAVALVAGIILVLNYRSKTSKVLEMYSASATAPIEDCGDSNVDIRGSNSKFDL